MPELNLEKILQTAKNLALNKENEVTWSKINELFMKILSCIENVDVNDLLNVWHAGIEKLFQRSVVSERSRLSGTCTEIILKMANVYKMNMCQFIDLTIYVPLLIKMTGMSNKIIVQRAEMCLYKTIVFLDVRILHKYVNGYINHNNKKVREIIYRIIEIAEDKSMFSEIITKGCNDPAWEVRAVVKRMLSRKEIPQIVKKEEKQEPVVKNVVVEKKKPKSVVKPEISKKEEIKSTHINYSQSTMELDKFLENIKTANKFNEEQEFKKMILQRKKEADRMLIESIEKQKKDNMDSIHDSVLAANDVITALETGELHEIPMEGTSVGNDESMGNKILSMIQEADATVVLEQKQNNNVDGKEEELERKKRKMRRSIESIKFDKEDKDETVVQNELIDSSIRFECADDSTFIMEETTKNRRNSLAVMIEEGVFSPQPEKPQQSRILTRRQQQNKK